MSELIDNRAQRIRQLKDIVMRLHNGESPDTVKPILMDLVKQCDAGEIAAMEQAIMADGVPLQQVMNMCDLHADVVRDLIRQRDHGPIQAGHPIDTFRRENQALSNVCEQLRTVINAMSPTGESDELALIRSLLFDLMSVDTHYQRKENLLFSCLERHGITGPSKVMWGKDDEARALLKAAASTLKSSLSGTADPSATLQSDLAAAVSAVESMIQKEETILFPMALETLTEQEWAEIWVQSEEFGWCLIEPGAEYQPLDDDIVSPCEAAPGTADTQTTPVTLNLMPPDKPQGLPEKTAADSGNVFTYPTGALSFAQLGAIFTTLPLDLTFVDADDRVLFFSEGPKRIFQRPKAVLGRKVQHCHPPSSLSIVEQILDDFKAGKQDVAEFWINFIEMFVHIRYFAVRDNDGKYLGTLELTQDVTAIRTLEGEQRLLSYETNRDNAASAASD
ncbi:MAG: DUF438 domain-containing protein [Planctomycetes bacterium]|nr:DUF438 domain-containing protein [Planctomycetota bacterium]NOG53672.1 DUF438 domain-containing protein [Planctomycetota bacterium]